MVNGAQDDRGGGSWYERLEGSIRPLHAARFALSDADIADGAPSGDAQCGCGDVLGCAPREVGFATREPASAKGVQIPGTDISSFDISSGHAQAETLLEDTYAALKSLMREEEAGEVKEGAGGGWDSVTTLSRARKVAELCWTALHEGDWRVAARRCSCTICIPLPVLTQILPLPGSEGRVEGGILLRVHRKPQDLSLTCPLLTEACDGTRSGPWHSRAWQGGASS